MCTLATFSPVFVLLACCATDISDFAQLIYLHLTFCHSKPSIASLKLWVSVPLRPSWVPMKGRSASSGTLRHLVA